MADKGVITREEVFKQDAINAPLEYAKNLDIAIATVEEIIAISQKYNELGKEFKGVKTTTEFLKLKKQEVGVSKDLADLLTKQRRAELELQKIKEKEIAIANKNLTLKAKEEAQKRRSITLTEQEKLEKSILNRLAREEAILNSSLVGAYQKLNLQRSQSSKKLRDLIASGKASRLEIQLATKQFEKYDAKVKKADKAVGDFTKNVGNYKSAFGGLSGVVRNLAGAFGFTSGIYIFSSLVKGAFNRIKEFDSSMQNLAGILRVNRSELVSLEDTILNVAGSSVKTSNEVATLAETLITLGKSKEEVEQLLKPVVDLGIGLDATGAEAGEFLIQMLNTFGSSTDEAAKYADTIATIRTSTSLDFQKMRDSFQYLAPISQALGKDLAYTGALVGILADNGIKAERAGRLMGTSQQKLAAEGRSLTDALEELNQAKAKNVSELDLLALSSNLFGKQSAALGIILANNSDIIDTNAQAIRDNGGALDDLVNEQLKSVDAKLKILDSSWEELILTVENGEGSLSNAFVGFIETITFAIQKTTELEKAQSDLFKIGVEESGWRSFFNGIAPGLNLISSGYEDAEKAQIKFNKQNEGITDNGLPILEQMYDKLNKTIKFKSDLSEDEVKVYKNQLSVIGRAITAKKDERKKLIESAEALDYANSNMAKYVDVSELSITQLKEYIDENKKVTDSTIKETEAQKKLREEKEKAANVKAVANTEKLNTSLEEAKVALRKEEIQAEIDKNQSIVDNEKKSFDERLKANLELKKNLLDLSKVENDEELNSLKDKLAKGDILENEFNVRKQILGIKKLANEEDINEKITENLGDTLKAHFDATVANLDKELEAKGAQYDQDAENLKKAEEQKREIIGQTSDFIARAFGLDSNNIQKLFTGLTDGFENFSEGLSTSLAVAGDVFNSLAGISAGFSEARIDAIDEEIEANDEKYERLLENENLSEEQRTLLEKQRDIEETKLNKKKAAEKTKQAKLEKANTLLQIAIQTSLGIISALAQVPKFDFGVSASLLAGVIGGIGAVQFAFAAAQPIPKFKDGHLQGTHEGFAITNDGGKQEVWERDGVAKLIEGVNTPINMKKGDKIYKSEEDYRKMFKNTTLSGLKDDRTKVVNAQKVVANDHKGNEALIAHYMAKEFAKQTNGSIAKQIKEGFKNVTINNNFKSNDSNLIYSRNNEF
ncbi:tape measure protein [Polaribacter phage Danklef_3]|nr:tape measure protein [Polaribacter phage Danklef_3]